MEQAARHFREALDENLEDQILTQNDRELLADMQGVFERSTTQ